MTKKDVSRRGFLRGIFHSASAVGLATLLNIVPEAKEVLANEHSVPYDVWPLPLQQTERLKQRALNDAKSVILRTHLNKQGFEEVPGIYFAYRVKFRGEDENGSAIAMQTDLLIVGCSNDTQGAMLWFAVDSSSPRSSQSNQRQSSFVVIQDEAISYVKDDQVTIYDDQENSLISASWFSEIVEGISPVDNKSPLLDHGVCSRIVDTCIIATGACVAATVCCIATLIWCGPQIIACGGAIAPCALASDCCNENPGTHDC